MSTIACSEASIRWLSVHYSNLRFSFPDILSYSLPSILSAWVYEWHCEFEGFNNVVNSIAADVGFWLLVLNCICVLPPCTNLHSTLKYPFTALSHPIAFWSWSAALNRSWNSDGSIWSAGGGSRTSIPSTNRQDMMPSFNYPVKHWVRFLWRHGFLKMLNPMPWSPLWATLEHMCSRLVFVHAARTKLELWILNSCVAIPRCTRMRLNEHEFFCATCAAEDKRLLDSIPSSIRPPILRLYINLNCINKG